MPVKVKCQMVWYWFRDLHFDTHLKYRMSCPITDTHLLSCIIISSKCSQPICFSYNIGFLPVFFKYRFLPSSVRVHVDFYVIFNERRVFLIWVRKKKLKAGSDSRSLSMPKSLFCFVLKQGHRPVLLAVLEAPFLHKYLESRTLSSTHTVVVVFKKFSVLEWFYFRGRK